MGKTLLQQVMEASIETLEEKLAAYKRHKAEYQLLGREFRFAKGNSKELASQYTFRIDPADNQRRRENTHHTGRLVHSITFNFLSIFLMHQPNISRSQSLSYASSTFDAIWSH
jgi:hypothetical protein